MTIYFDENLPPVFAEGFERIQQPLLRKMGIQNPVTIKSVTTEFGQGLTDEEVFEKLAGTASFYITQDLHIHNRLHQRLLYEQAGLGMFFIESRKKGTTYWEYVELLIKRWPEIVDIASKVQQPFAYLIRRTGKIGLKKL